jgi:hypothetical protein
MPGTFVKPRDGFWNDLATIFAADLDSPLLIFLLFLYGVCFLDVATTTMVLSQGGIELNPLMEKFAGSPLMHLLLKWLVVFFIFLAASYCEQKLRKSGIIILGVMILWFLVVVIHNVFILVTPL